MTLPSRDLRPHIQKTHPVASGADRTAWGRAHDYCMACGAGEYGMHVLTTHELIGGRGGRSQEPANWLRLGMHPCHDLATGLDVRGDSIFGIDGDVVVHRPLLPKITLGIALSMKLRAGELTEADLERLRVLHGRPLPDLEEIPQWFVEKWKRNRPTHEQA